MLLVLARVLHLLCKRKFVLIPSLEHFIHRPLLEALPISSLLTTLCDIYIYPVSVNFFTPKRIKSNFNIISQPSTPALIAVRLVQWAQL